MSAPQPVALYTVTIRGRWHEAAPTAAAFDLPDGEHLLYAAPPTREPVRLTNEQREALGLMLQHFGRDERIECLRPLAANGVTP